MKFKATEVLADYNDNWVLNIFFSRQQNGEEIYFSIQDAYDREDEQEIALKQDTYYIELNSQKNGGYGGIKELELSTESLKIIVNKSGQNSLNLQDNSIEVSFRLQQKEIENLKEKINEIFEQEKGERHVNISYKI